MAHLVVFLVSDESETSTAPNSSSTTATRSSPNVTSGRQYPERSGDLVHISGMVHEHQLP
ncbi:MAG: hypothetical protein R2710_25130 [Acidimicrobiales bacterium]